MTVKKGLNINDQDLAGRYIVIKETELSAAYRKPMYAIAKANGGFGCSPTSMGRAVFCTHLDGENVRWNRSEVERFATDKEVEAAKKEYADTKAGEGI